MTGSVKRSIHKMHSELKGSLNIHFCLFDVILAPHLYKAPLSVSRVSEKKVVLILIPSLELWC